MSENADSKISSFSLRSWRNIYLIFSTVIRFVVCLQTSYIHPDEFFQSFQPIYNDNIPWEFSSANISRSFVPLYIAYYPIIYVGSWLGLSSLTVYFLVKLEFCLLTWVILEWCLYRVMPAKPERVKASFFVNTSYITLVYQSHTFSNSLETCILLPVLYIINDIRGYLESKSRERYSLFKLTLLGVLVSLGVFNRITFVCWLLLPSIFLIKFFLQHTLRSFVPICSFIAATVIFILVDTYHFHGSLDGLVIAPLNNILYNTDYNNLAKHGIHPLYTQLLINYPQIFGPLIFLLYPFGKEYINTTMFLSYVSGFLSLSLIPHQELRFLIPAVPLACSCISLKRSRKLSSLIIKLWIVFNAIMILFMGVLHQGGVVPAMSFLENELGGDTTALLFWRTYKPPTWLLKDHLGSCAYFNRDEDNLLDLDYASIERDYSVDFMGFDTDGFVKTVSRIVSTNSDGRKVYLVAPFNAMLNLARNEKVEFNFEELWSTSWHYDMDHFEYDKFGYRTFIPGIGVYCLTR